MEIEYAFRASSAAQRREAIVAYMEGEKLCDEGDLSSGMKMLKRASFLAWELSLEEWPSWANALRAELSGARGRVAASTSNEVDRASNALHVHKAYGRTDNM